MCFTKPKAPKPGAPPAPPANAGADTLVLGPSANTDDEQLRNAGVLGRLALRVGRFGAGAGGAGGGGDGLGGGSVAGGVGTGTGTGAGAGTGTGTGAGLGVGTGAGSEVLGGGGMCVAPDTSILMADGETRPAGDLVVGDLLHTKREDNGEWGDFPVEAISTAKNEPLFYFAGLIGTGEHRIWHGGEWQELSRIGRGVGFGPVVKITVTDAHTYMSSGILSHNAKQRAD
jgi:hypothetical protein